jgi:hypothetical protein
MLENCAAYNILAWTAQKTPFFFCLVDSTENTIHLLFVGRCTVPYFAGVA